MKINITHDLKAGTYESDDARVRIDAGAGSDSELTLDFQLAPVVPVVTDPPPVTVDPPPVIVDPPAPPAPPVDPPAPPTDTSDPAPAPAPAPAPPASGLTPFAPFALQVQPTNAALPNAVITGTAGGKPVNLTVIPGQRMPLVTNADGTYAFQYGCAMYYPDGGIVIENSYAGVDNPTPMDVPVDLSITCGTFTASTGGITVWYKGWTQPYWTVAPTVQAFDRSLFPYYSDAGSKASAVASFAKSPQGPMATALWCQSMGTTGERGDLGLLPSWDAMYLTNPSADAANVVFGMADAIAPFPFHAIDTQTNQMLLAGNYKFSCMGAYAGQYGNPFMPLTGTSVCPISMSEAQAHAPAFNALAAALRGTAYDKANLAQWANYIGSLWIQPAYRISNGGPTHLDSHVQTRGAAWCLRTVAQAAKLSDHPDLFAGWLTEMASEIPAIAAKPGMPMLLANVQYPPVDAGPPPVARGYGMFQLDYFVAATGYAIQLGNKEFQPLLDYFQPFVTDRMLAVQHEFATIYEATYKDTSGNVAANWVQSLQFTTATSPALAAAFLCAEGSQALQTAMSWTGLPGDFNGYPESPDGTGYSAIYRGAAAYTAAFATNQTAAQAAWAKFLLYDREVYTTGPKYSVMPRATVPA
jgi:hypothetical protein